jgi:hypothetical protein
LREAVRGRAGATPDQIESALSSVALLSLNEVYTFLEDPEMFDEWQALIFA